MVHVGALGSIGRIGSSEGPGVIPPSLIVKRTSRKGLSQKARPCQVPVGSGCRKGSGELGIAELVNVEGSTRSSNIN
jgi:hypothetical protein